MPLLSWPARAPHAKILWILHFNPEMTLLSHDVYLNTLWASIRLLACSCISCHLQNWLAGQLSLKSQYNLGYALCTCNAFYVMHFVQKLFVAHFYTRIIVRSKRIWWYCVRRIWQTATDLPEGRKGNVHETPISPGTLLAVWNSADRPLRLFFRPCNLFTTIWGFKAEVCSCRSSSTALAISVGDTCCLAIDLSKDKNRQCSYLMCGTLYLKSIRLPTEIVWHESLPKILENIDKRKTVYIWEAGVCQTSANDSGTWSCLLLYAV